MKVSIIILISSVILINTINFLSYIPIEKEKEAYNEPSQELRAVWVSPWGGDQELCQYVNEEDFKKKMTYILDTIKMYNMNTIIYHVRTHNDALYKSKLNPLSVYWSKVNFDTFDPLKWLIEESHTRGIEFHAWMNPYRVKSSSKISLEEIAKSYSNFKANPASSVSNMLKGTTSVILNPGLQNVRNFIVDTVSELVQNYNVDAVHFDDYFYIDMGANGKTTGPITILNETDRGTYEKYIDTHPGCNFSKTNANDKADWRRLQVDLFINQLHESLKNFNVKNNRFVELGIAPTGVYKNGDGVVTYDDKGNAITKGSATSEQTHFSSFLFCDTLKWINNEWIDYILPQSYWAFTHPYGPYSKVMGWWDKVVKYKKVNLYSGIGLYMADQPDSIKTYGWQNDMFELANQIKFIGDSDRIDGASIYNFKALRNLRDHKSTKSAKQVQNALNNAVWKNKVPQAEKKFMDKIVLSKVNNFRVYKNNVYFDKLNGAKFYCIYKSKNTVTFKSSEIVDIFSSNLNEITWEDKDTTADVHYGVKALSYTNTLGDGAQ